MNSRVKRSLPGHISALSLLWTLLLGLVIFNGCHAQGQTTNKTQLNRAYLQTPLDGNGQAITNAGTVAGTNFVGNGSGLTNIGGIKLIPAGATANAFAQYTVSVVTGKTYFFDFQSPDFGLDNGSATITAAGTFVASNSTVVVEAQSGNAPVASQIYGPLQNNFGTYYGDGSHLSGISSTSLTAATNNDTVVSNAVISAAVLKASNGTDFQDVNTTRSNIGVSYLSRVSASFGTNSFGGDMSNATPAAAYMPAITQQGGQTAVWIPASTTKGDYKHRLAFPGGVQAFGDENGLADPNYGNAFFYLGYGTNFTNGSSDTLLHVRGGATSPNNSGTGINLDICYLDPVTGTYKILDSVGCSFIYVNTNKIDSLIPGYAELVFNRSKNMKGLAVCGPGFNGLDSGNASMQYWDFFTQEVGIPYYQAGLYNPTNTGFLKAFAISPNTALASFYSNVTIGGSSYIARGITNGANFVTTNNAYIEGTIRAGTGASGGGGQVITLASGNLNGAVLDANTAINISGAQVSASIIGATKSSSSATDLSIKFSDGFSGFCSFGNELRFVYNNGGAAAQMAVMGSARGIQFTVAGMQYIFNGGDAALARNASGVVEVNQGTVGNYGDFKARNITATNSVVIGTIKISFGTGSPNGVVTGSVGDQFMRTDGGAATTLYVKESGTATTSGWVGK